MINKVASYIYINIYIVISQNSTKDGPDEALTGRGVMKYLPRPPSNPTVDPTYS
jgi:hypothetical protein